MATTKINARDWTFEIGDGDPGGTGEVYTEIGGINTMTIGREAEDTDTTTFESAGNAEHEVMQRGRTFEVEGFYLEDVADGTRDPGQEMVETVGDAVGTNSLRNLRITSPGGTTLTQQVSVEVGDVGGGNNDKTSWSATFTRSGATTKGVAA